MKTPAHTPLAPAEFADRMAGLGPFEPAPHIAVACSGGPDSMALALLADHWARSCGGVATALVVDHGMRQDSAQEAETVGAWLAEAGIEAVTLTRPDPGPASDRQAMARRARYALMRGWCRQAGVLHLLLGHHRQDQAETFLLRLARGSGVDGLAAMAPVHETGDVRLLRPLLDVPRKRLRAYLKCEGRPFVQDPSNDDSAFARVRMRTVLPSLEREGLTAARLAATARRMARARAALETAATAVLARAAAVYPEGYATVIPAPLREAPEDVGLRALSRLLSCIGGNEYTPRMERLERLYAWLAEGRSAGAGRTLAGCRIIWRGETILVCREASAVQDPIAALPGAIWDGRFRLAAGGRAPNGSRVGRLGREGWDKLVRERPELRTLNLPAPVRLSLPAVRALDEVIAVPHLSYRWDKGDWKAPAVDDITFLPARPLSAAAFRSPAGFP
jgi:tRNA(Ile)-lysidine synthase